MQGVFGLIELRHLSLRVHRSFFSLKFYRSTLSRGRYPTQGSIFFSLSLPTRVQLIHLPTAIAGNIHHYTPNCIVSISSGVQHQSTDSLKPYPALPRRALWPHTRCDKCSLFCRTATSLFALLLSSACLNIFKHSTTPFHGLCSGSCATLFTRAIASIH